MSKSIRATLVLLATLMVAASASATRQAVVNLVYKNQFLAGTTFGIRGETVVVTVGNTPTDPLIVWPANRLSCPAPCAAESFTYTGNYTVFASRMGTFMNQAARVSANHAGAAPTGGSTVPIPTMTTKCFATVSPTVVPGPPNLPGSCFPRGATLMRFPGAKKYGGTARMLDTANNVGTFVAFSPPANDLFNFNNVQTAAQKNTTTFVGNYGLVGTGTFTNTVLGTARQTQGQGTIAPVTTGLATAKGGFFGTALSVAGSHAFNTANLTGMISMVQPFVNNQFSRNQAGGYIGNTLTLGAVAAVDLTFLPEPGILVMLGCGVAGLAGLAALRRR